jgi:Histidine phosphatase superfamily (branch 1)
VALNLSPQQTEALIEERRQAVLLDPSLRDAPLTDVGRQQARDCAQQLQRLIKEGVIKHAPSEAMVSPLSRTLETCQILLQGFEPKIQQAHIRSEIQERQTQCHRLRSRVPLPWSKRVDWAGHPIATRFNQSSDETIPLWRFSRQRECNT